MSLKLKEEFDKVRDEMFKEDHNCVIQKAVETLLKVFDEQKESFGCLIPSYEPFVLIDVAHIFTEEALRRQRNLSK